MEDTTKKELFPYFAYSYSKENYPDKYGAIQDFDKWHNLISEDSEILNEITQAAMDLEDGAWEKLNKIFRDRKDDGGGIQEAKYGAKLNNLKKLRAVKTKKKGGKTTKCSCGCDLVVSKAAGGAVGTGKHGKGCPCCNK